ncbi:MAG: endonuclease [Oscillospiraceae bacterium]|nr:endonuclease [Oscillospiraceae bacterium]
MKKVLKVLLILLLVIIVAVGALLGWLTATEYNPDPVIGLTALREDATETLSAGEELRILSWNIGYAGLGKESDFFMDGGEHVNSADEAAVRRYLSGIETTVASGDYDLVLLQEVDVDSSRTFRINEAEALASGDAYQALNYSCPFVPNPNTLIIEPLGRINSGLLTTSEFSISSSERHALPCPFSWPLRIANLKRCLLVSYLPIEGSESQLVLVNLHLEAYDSGEGKIAQTKQLREFIRSEYEKGNYVIAGGDFNQVFPGSLEVYPNEHPDLWTVGALDESSLPGEGWQYAYDASVPTCRLLNQPYDPADTENTQYYVIDGFILSPNVELVSVNSLDMAFENSDHNPVSLCIRLK